MVQADRIRARRAAWFAEHGPCVQCGSWADLELDHVDPTTKHPWLGHGVGRRPSVWTWRKELRDAELLKCQALCALCHKEKTREQLAVKEIPHGTPSGYVRHKCRCPLCKTWRREESRRYRQSKKGSTQ